MFSLKYSLIFFTGIFSFTEILLNFLVTALFVFYLRRPINIIFFEYLMRLIYLFILLYIHLLAKHLLMAFYVPSIVRGAWNKKIQRLKRWFQNIQGSEMLRNIVILRNKEKINSQSKISEGQEVRRGISGSCLEFCRT